jgi:type IV pilus assembly protein PilA
MKVEMKAKFLQYLLNKNDPGGFTKTGLLVRMFLYSCVSLTVTLPFCVCRWSGFGASCCTVGSQCNQGRQIEARNNIGALNRAQQAYNQERGGFATIDNVGVGIKPESTSYSYHILPNGPVQTSNDPKESAPSFEAVINIAQPKVPHIKGYMGVVWTDTDMNTSQSITRAILCEQKQAVSSPLPSPMPPSSMPTLSNGTPQCPQGWVTLGT